MDRSCPSYYVEPSAESSLHDTRALIDSIAALAPTNSKPGHEPLVQPILTPRFAISCTDKLLEGLGEIAQRDPKLRIQTHISENKAEVTYTLELFPKSKTYAAVYDSFGLLRRGTVLAHAVHLDDSELDLICERGAGISHCPTSNFNLSSGVARVGEMIDRGINVCLPFGHFHS